MVPAEDAVIEEGGTSCSLTGSFCRPRPRRVLLLVVAVLVLGQLSLNMLFYRNSDSLFYVNTTASAAGPLLLDSRPVPVNHSNHTPSLPITNTSSSQPGRRAEGTEAERRQRTRENSSTNLEEESVGSGTRPVKLQELAAAPPTMPANSPRVALPPSAAVPPSNDNKLTSNNEGGLGRATQAAVSVDKPLCPPVPPKLGTGKFNRAMLMNVGALEALRHYPFNCFIFHDVDLLLEDDRNLYTCPEQPRHMSIAIDNMKYRLPYNDIFGGVSAMTVEQFRTVNGFSNKFWGWGGEDDDMSNRIKHHGFFISRYPANVGRYTMLTHKKDNPNPRRYQYLHEGKKRYSSDGLNSVKYRLLDTQLRRLYTWVYVDLYPS
ncbi:Beta-1,4-N-acetylgalactosaminyltransferase bre-4 [Portunus trituberculatus]|uniref:Beta-1,4-N-acetylgalactosaminyltransferase n=1 Tax=Portunus trituberculatus TaxID=210409 RepID=A0A5B7F094_PORTR|nr:Beta-1,4-N-acetylgalactosaminyltransferase bre-4 [Portunus trituberculatus]